MLNQPNDISARGSMLLGAAMAGCAIEASMLGAAHSLANPLTAHYNIVHGQAVGMMLPYVVRFNSEIEECRGVYVNLMKVAQIECENESADEVNNLVAYLQNLLQQTGLPIRLRDVIADKSELKVLAKEASAQWTAGFNPRLVGEIEMEKIYIDAY